MSYSRNFGFRSFQNIIRDGRNRVPSSGDALVIGAPVAVDADKPGTLKAVAEGAAPTQLSGVVLYEHIENRDAAMNPTLTTYADFDKVPLGQYAQLVHGVGVKVWFKNTGAKTLYDGRVRAAAGLLASSVTVSALKPGDGLTPDGNGKYKKAALAAGEDPADPVWFIVESANSSTGVVEARFTF